MKNKNIIIIIGSIFLLGIIFFMYYMFFTCNIKDVDGIKYPGRCTLGEYNSNTDFKRCRDTINERSLSLIPEELINETYKKYNIKLSDRTKYKIDELIPFYFGGLYTENNLWPQPIEQFIQKNKVEALLYINMCEGKMTYDEAINILKTNWSLYFY